MKAVIATLFTILLQHVSVGQTVTFDDESSWNELKEEARENQKLIFIDVVATWCVPCKKMDKDVYSDSVVATALSQHFISAKFQIDTSHLDNSSVIKRYNDAAFIARKYQVEAVPTFLFFDSSGRLIFKSLGYQEKSMFLNTVDYVRDTASRFYEKLMQFENHSLPSIELPSLAKTVNELLRDRDLEIKIARTYKENYLDSLHTSGYSKREFDFITSYPELLSSDDRLFQFLYNQGSEGDSIVQDAGWSERVVKNVIAREEIWSRLLKENIVTNRYPDWAEIERHILSKYGTRYTASVLYPARPAFYKYVKDWKNFVKYRNAYIKKFPPFNTSNDFDPQSIWSLNVDAWDLFLNCDEKKLLKTALRWSQLTIDSDKSIPPNDQYLDTKANLLYKLGYVRRAIETEQKALELTKKSGEPDGAPVYRDVLSKMRKGVPTWK